MNAVLGTINKDYSSVIDSTHPPILGTSKAKSAGVLKEGLVLAKDATGEIVAYNPAGASPLNKAIGVLTNDCDTANDDAAVFIKHGTVNRSKLLVGSSEPDNAAIAALEAISIYAL